MTPLIFDPVPFLTRKMLAFEHAVKLELYLAVYSYRSTPLKIKVVTREGISTFKWTTDSTGMVDTTTFPIPDVPIMVSVDATDGLPAQGEVFVELDLMMDGNRIHTLLHGYVYPAKALTYPPTVARDSRPEGGYLFSNTGSNPAVGAEIAQNTAVSDLYKPLSLMFTLVTDATVVSRRVRVRFRDANDVVIFETVSNAAIGAGITAVVVVAPWGALPYSPTSGFYMLPLPMDFVLPPGADWLTSTDSLQAGDNYGAPQEYWEVFKS